MVPVAARLLKEARLRGGLSQAELARRAGTSQPAVSAYEQGHKDPSAATLARLLAATGTSLATTVGPASVREYLRTTGLAPDFQAQRLTEVAERVRGGEDVWFALREFLDGVALVTEVEGAPAARALLADRPVPAGQRVDALLAGLAEHVATAHGLPRPAWVTEPDRFLNTWWFPHRRRAFDAMAVRDSPAAFRRRGIFLCPSMLERV